MKENVKFWAVFLLYEPFTMGGYKMPEGCNDPGPCYIPHRFEAEGYRKTIGGFDCVVVEAPGGTWHVYHEKSGGCLGHGDREGTAIALAIENIACTPSLKKQIKALGDPTRFTEVSPERAWKAIESSRKKKAQAKPQHRF
jgi:hypothetical protein